MTTLNGSPIAPHPIAAVMIHVADVTGALAWYQSAFPNAVRVDIQTPRFECLSIDGIQLEFVLCDDKVASGPCGSVVYWWMENFEVALDHFRSVGATLYRGPLEIEDCQRICQVQDPWGNCIGLRGRQPDRGALAKTEPIKIAYLRRSIKAAPPRGISS